LKNSIKFYLKAKEIEELYFENLISITSKINYYEKAKKLAKNDDLIYFAINQNDKNLREKYLVQAANENYNFVAMNSLGLIYF
jgi:hypothetical protein